MKVTVTYMIYQYTREAEDSRIVQKKDKAMYEDDGKRAKKASA